MRTVAVKVDRHSGQSIWFADCSTCGWRVLSPDLRGALMAAHRHVKECTKPVSNSELHVLSKAWETWVIGFM